MVWSKSFATHSRFSCIEKRVEKHACNAHAKDSRKEEREREDEREKEREDERKIKEESAMPTYQTLYDREEPKEKTGGGVPVVKLLIIGDSGVGKSCLLSRWLDDTFDTSFVSTLGMDFRCQNIKVKNQWVRMQVWDTAGQEKFKAVTASYYRGSHGVLLCYAVNDRSSFAAVDAWLEGFFSQGGEEGTPITIIGNKCDLERQVTFEEGRVLAQSHDCLFLETSAKSGKNVVSAFDDIAERMLGVHQVRSELLRKSQKESVPDFESLIPRQRKNSCCPII